MNIPFLGIGRKKSGTRASFADPDAITALLAECGLLRSQAEREGVELDDSAVSLERLDQLAPRWRDDAETLADLGHDAGLYLGTVVVRTVPGAAWEIRAVREPVVRLASGREVDVVRAGQEWAASGVPELSQLYAEVAEG
ncbi:DUF6278 family protein [Streptomyces sp. NPDC006186]|uniref:DUF6278 family protein n=1 Tax=Streptomyces sp. NPDC006186 TaxID=3155248 RepID=UPI0033A7ADDE